MAPERARAIFNEQLGTISRHTDRAFSLLFFLQWLIGIAFAFAFSPRTWSGAESSVHIHIYAAILLGGTIAAGPILLVYYRPNSQQNMNYLAAAQIFFSALFIHLTNGRIETHFHVFGSLAFLAFYRRREPLLVAAGVTILDHLLRGYFLPASVYGTLAASPFRALEHGAWVVFEVTVLLVSVKTSNDELWSIADTRARLEYALQKVEKKAEIAKEELVESRSIIRDHQEQLAASSQMSALGEFAGGIAHEINNPIAVLNAAIDRLEARGAKGEISSSDVTSMLPLFKRNMSRIVKIVNSLRRFSRKADEDPMERLPLSSVLEDVVELCRDSLKGAQIDLQIDAAPDLVLECHPSEIAQILVNLVCNSRDAIAEIDPKWIRIEAKAASGFARISVIDSGRGIPSDVLQNLMTPFFTTKPAGKGTGLGLTISRKIAASHGGSLEYDASSPNTCFVLTLPDRTAQAKKAS